MASADIVGMSRNPREEIISLLRGQIACPLISTLGELGWIGTMLDGPFDHHSFRVPVDAEVFRSIMNYLAALRLVEQLDGDTRFRATRLGSQVLARFGTFCILNSYEAYMRALGAMLVPDGSVRPEVDRTRNVIGSGAIHGRKFFGDALNMLGEGPYRLIVDIGCGDGKFLSGCARAFPQADVLAVDISATAVERTLSRIKAEGFSGRVDGVVADGANVVAWASHVPPLDGANERILLSCWFLIHEISQSNPGVVIRYFKKLRAACPNAHVLVGEVVRHSQQTLAINRETSVLPELTLVHDLSQQGLIDWDQWKQIAAEIPYELYSERQYDPVRTDDGEVAPSSFIWCLRPR